MSETINWGIMGLGKIAHKFAQDLALSEQSQLQAVASRNLEKAQEFGSEYKASNCYGSYEEMVKDDKIDVVYIATPHVFHHKDTLMCLENGKAVLCEKPFAINRREVEEMIDLATSKDLFLMEAIWTRFIPGFEKALEMVDTDRIGQVREVKANFGFEAAYDPKGRLFNLELGGGSLLDIGIYPVYLSYVILGEPTEIKATAEFTNGVDSSCHMEFEYEEGRRAFLDCTFDRTTSTEAIITGSEGNIRIHRRFHHPEKITLILKDGSEETIEIPYKGNGYLHEIEEVNDCLLSEGVASKKMSLQDSLSLIKTLDRVRENIGLRYPPDKKPS